MQLLLAAVLCAALVAAQDPVSDRALAAIVGVRLAALRCPPRRNAQHCTKNAEARCRRLPCQLLTYCAQAFVADAASMPLHWIYDVVRVPRQRAAA